MDKSELWQILEKEIELLKNETDESHHGPIEKAYHSIQKSLEQFFNEQVSIPLPHPHPRSRLYRSEPEHWKIIDTHPKMIFTDIVTRSKRAKNPACIFDLDGTLFDVGNRTLGILHDWLQTDQAMNCNKTFLKKVEKINYHHVGYSLSHAFENAGFDLRNPATMELFLEIERNWRKNFFDGKSLLKYDTMLPFGNEFVNGLYENSIHIIYLTGRSKSEMEEGTQKQLEKFGFPIKNATLIMKEDKNLEDYIFKGKVVKNLLRTKEIVGNFENEYLNLAYMANETKKAVHVIVDSQHSGRPTPPLKNIPVYRIYEYMPPSRV